MAFIGAGQSDTLRYDLKGKRPRGPRRMCAKVTLEPFTGSSVGYRFGPKAECLLSDIRNEEADRLSIGF